MSPRPTDLDEIIAEFLAAVERGQAPDPVDWIARHPDLALDLALFLADLGQFGDFLGLPSFSNPDLTREYTPSNPQAREPRRDHGERFGEYELLGEPIGKGGMGVVYRARLAGTSLVVALKQLRASGGQTTSRFREEIETAIGLRHPNIVPVYHVGELAGRPFFTMALVEGGSLDQQLSRFPSDPRATAQLMVKVARAVHHAHQRRVLHRDLKPSNILLDDAGEPHVADFGLAARLTETGATIDAGPAAGSLPWMAPEAVRGEATLTTAVDVWALGVILYELLTGQRPFPRSDPQAVRQAILEEAPPPPSAVNPNVPPDLAAVGLRCLEKNPDRRYESASAVALELERWLRDEPVRARRASRGERFTRWCRRNPGVAAGLMTSVAVLIAITAGAIKLANDLENALVARVCSDSEYNADQVAGNVAQRFKQLGSQVNATADELAQLDLHDATDKARAVRKLEQLVTTPIAPGKGRPFVNAFVLTPEAVIHCHSGSKMNEGPFPYRDYFIAAPPEGVHISQVYTSKADNLDKLALSTRFRPKQATQHWVLAATITTDDRLELGVTMSDEKHKAILVARKENEGYVILVHPALKANSPSIRFLPDQPGTTRPFESNGDYRDPLADDAPNFRGRWLTGSARVGDSDHLVVVVQQKYNDAVNPFQSFFWQLAAWLGGALGIGLVSYVVFRQGRAHRYTRTKRTNS